MTSPPHETSDRQHETGNTGQTNGHDRGSDGGQHGGGDEQMKKKHERRMYLKIAAMIATAAVVMFVVMYSSVYDLSHIHYSQERLYMALTFTGAMALIMLAYMATMSTRTGR